jgi:hypothetical protein
MNGEPDEREKHDDIGGRADHSEVEADGKNQRDRTGEQEVCTLDIARDRSTLTRA